MVAVVAAYRPDAGLVDRVAATASQVLGVVVVDDGTPAGTAHGVFDALAAAGAVVLHQPDNRGIAAALNAGIAEARRRWRPEYVLTLDQDSTLTPGYVAHAVDTCRRARAAGLAVGFVAASAYGPHATPTRRSPDAFPRAFDPMQSGSLVPVATFDALGGYDEGLFIDGVDSEYTARCNAAGLAVLVGRDCVLEHALGRREQTRVLGRGVSIAGRPVTFNHHAPSRVFYIARNGTALTLRHLRDDPAWVARRLVEEAKAHGMRLVLGNNRVRTARAMASGFWAAARGRSGKIPDAVARRLGG